MYSKAALEAKLDKVLEQQEKILQRTRVLMDREPYPRCTCDDNCDDPCPKHCRENALQDRAIAAENKVKELQCQIRTVFGVEDAMLRHQISALNDQIYGLKAGRKRAAQTLIKVIGAEGPESIEDTVTRAAKLLEDLDKELQEKIEELNNTIKSKDLRIEEESQISSSQQRTISQLQGELEEARRELELAEDRENSSRCVLDNAMTELEKMEQALEAECAETKRLCEELSDHVFANITREDPSSCPNCNGPLWRK